MPTKDVADLTGRTSAVGRCLVCLLFFVAMPRGWVLGETPLDIGKRRELFVDDALIEELGGCALRLHAPQQGPGRLPLDRPWEGAFSGYATFLVDGERFRLYYRGLPESGKDGTDREVTCCATSADGVHWDKPELGLYEVGGTRRNNVVLAGQTPASHNFSPFVDTNPAARPQERFKALGGTSGGLLAFASQDGFRWRRLQPEPVFTQGVFDSQNVAFWSATEQKYVCYFRDWTDGDYAGYRTISRTTSDDFLHWSAPARMTFGDTPVEHLYTNQTTPYFRAPHIYLGLAARFLPGRRVLSAEQAAAVGVDRNYFGDCSDTVLLTSRGGSRYHRTFMESLIRPGLGRENWVSRSNYAARGLVPTSTQQMSLYLSRNYGQPTAFLQQYLYRWDGLASLRAGYGGGRARTRLVRFGGPRPQRWGLEVNFSTSAAGSLRIGLLNDEGQPWPGLALDDCDPLIGDRISQTVTWRDGDQDVSSASGRSIQLVFDLKDADLFFLPVFSAARPVTRGSNCVCPRGTGGMAQFLSGA